MSALWAQEATPTPEDRAVTKEQIRDKYGIDMSTVRKGPTGLRKVYPEELRKHVTAVSYKVDNLSAFSDELGLSHGVIHHWRKLYGKGALPEGVSMPTPTTNGHTAGLPVIPSEKRTYTRKAAKSNGSAAAATFECASIEDAAAVLGRLSGLSAGRVSITIH